MAWWVWVLLGFALIACELLTPGGFFFLFFGIAGVVVGFVVWAGLVTEAWLQWLLFTVAAVGAMMPLRGRMVRWMTPAERPVDSLVGEAVTLLEDLPPGGAAKAELRGTTWNARNAGERPLARGARAFVSRVDGLTLWVRAE
jgi:inner membrane protein